ncbi:MAG: SEL1-like repeat protein [Terriglobia bacterium]|nr:SEL1-like repeat protein [Terriglobia bacterium]
MYLKGLGTPRDPQTAYVWLKAAELGGDKSASALLNGLDDELTDEQIATARKQAAELVPNNPENLVLAGIRH